MAKNDDGDGGGQEIPFWQTKSFLASAGVVGVVVLAGLALVIQPLLPASSPPGQGSESTHFPLGPSGEPVLPSEVPLSDASESVCGLEPQEGEFEGFPEGTSWDYVGAMQVPSHEDHGPGLLSEDRVPSCWALSPEGAVNAALAYGALTNDAELALPAAEQMLAEGKGRETALKGLREQGAQVVRSEFRGVRLLTFGFDRARVDIALVVGDLASETLISSVVDLRWEDGDWKVATRDDGSMMVPPSTVSDVSNYTPIGQ
ncbi:hypothetical protein ACWFMI_27060 [Nocardiopsis terrae]